MRLRNWTRVYREEAGGEGGAGGGEGGAPTFIETLPEDLRTNESLGNFKDVGGLAKSFVELKSMQGNSIRIPSAEASEDDRNAFNAKLLEQVPSLMYKPDFDNPEQSAEFYATLGKPSQAADYTMPEIEGVAMPEERGNALREVAHKYNLTKAQFEGIMQETLAMDAAAIEGQLAKEEAELNALKGEWGHTFEERKNAIVRVAEHTGAPDRLIDAIKEDEAGKETMEWLNKISGMIKGEDTNFSGGDVGSGKNSGMLTPAEARSQISDINNNRSHPYWNQNDPAHADALMKMTKLQEMARAAG